VSREVHAGFCERRGVRLPPATHLVVLISGAKAHAEALKTDVAAVLSEIGLRLAEEKTTVCHINEGFDFLGFRIQRKRKRGSNKVFVYTWPSKKALASIMATIKAITRQPTSQPLSALLRQLNAALRGWTVYFRHGCSKQTFGYLNHYTWHRVVGWLRRKRCRATWKSIRRRYMRAVTARTLVPHDDGIALFNAASVPVTRYRYRGTKIDNPWTQRPATTKTTR
jgi:RNA-directed DNA polymerase